MRLVIHIWHFTYHPNDLILPIQVPKSDATSSADEVEVFMYKHMFEYLQCYAERTSRKKNEIQMPIPIGMNFKCIKYLRFLCYDRIAKHSSFCFFSFSFPLFGKRQRSQPASDGEFARSGIQGEKNEIVLC